MMRKQTNIEHRKFNCNQLKCVYLCCDGSLFSVHETVFISIKNTNASCQRSVLSYFFFQVEFIGRFDAEHFQSDAVLSSIVPTTYVLYM